MYANMCNQTVIKSFIKKLQSWTSYTQKPIAFLKSVHIVVQKSHFFPWLSTTHCAYTLDGILLLMDIWIAFQLLPTIIKVIMTLLIMYTFKIFISFV